MIKLEKMGSGSYGAVYTAKEGKNSNEIAVKRNFVDSDISFSGCIRELDLLNRLRGHPYIVKLISISFGSPFITPNSPFIEKKGERTRDDYLYFVFEKGEKNLHDLIYEKDIHFGYLKLSMVQILLAVEYMHAKGVIHRDIKPANLLWFVDKDKTSVKLCDFGLSKIKTRQEPSSPGVVTCWYRAPEICTHDNNYSFSSDIWSVGCVFYEMIAKNALLLGSKDDDNKILSKIIGLSPSNFPKDLKKLNSGRKITLTKEASPKRKKTWRELVDLEENEIEEFNKYPEDGAKYEDFLDLLNELLKLIPEERFTATQALNHPFFHPYKKIIDWSRENFPPEEKKESLINIIDCVERKWAIREAFYFFNKRGKLEWYKHRILFQSIDMFDRYLEYCEKNMEQKKESSNNGKFMTKDEVNLRYKVCLYMCIKYFTTLIIPISYEELVEEKLTKNKKLIEAENFEQKMLKDVLCFKIYRETIFESADKLNLTLDEYKVRDILENYGKKIVTGMTSLELLKNILSDINLSNNNI